MHQRDVGQFVGQSVLQVSEIFAVERDVRIARADMDTDGTAVFAVRIVRGNVAVVVLWSSESHCRQTEAHMPRCGTGSFRDSINVWISSHRGRGSPSSQ